MIDGMSRPGPGRDPAPRLPGALVLAWKVLRQVLLLTARALRGLSWVWSQGVAWLTAEEEEPPDWATSDEWVHGIPGGLRAACLGLMVAVPLCLVGLRVYGRILSDPDRVVNGRADVLTYLTRAVAAEAGGNGYCPREAKVAVAAAMLSKIQDLQKIPRDEVRGHHVRRFLDRQHPNYLQGYRTNPIYDRNLDWLEQNGFSECVDAARAALSGEDPSGGARHWYDDSIPAPHPGDVIEITKEFSTRGNRLIFYRFRPGAKVRPQIRPGPAPGPKAITPPPPSHAAGRE